ncbi:MAG: hypothetical protein C0608_06910 [Deltaproteobacteria bacterium]|nr:MAG: hypothetical protein C0608_06910 [Deltaproteobacteria bacterium]
MLIFVSGMIAIFLLLTGIFAYESYREEQPRAFKIGIAMILVALTLAASALLIPATLPLMTILFALILLVAALLIFPSKRSEQALKGAGGYVIEEHKQVDERDIIFARLRSLQPGTERYDNYYMANPEFKFADDRRRDTGGLIGSLGAIDGRYQPNTSMPLAMGSIPQLLGPYASFGPIPGRTKAELNPAEASKIIKGLAEHLGAVAVGICRVDKRWTYSHRGDIHFENWEDWGKAIGDPLPYAVVFITEMDHDLLCASPHTPTIVESMTNYAKGAFISTVLAKWFAGMGYHGDAEHWRHYNHNMVPLAIDAGLGELGRFGYLISDKVGGRCRIAACLTDMPLEVDSPVDLGVEVFCERCMKCADSCPSKSITKGKKTIDNGRLLWKLDPESCYDYWCKVGTDCGICMGVCPFSRPNRSVHKLVRWFVKRSSLAQRVFPLIDNMLYGKKWKVRKPKEWAAYPKN